MSYRLIVNPAAGGGRAGRALPEVESTLGALGLEHRSDLTRSLEHARELAYDALASGHVPVAFGGDGLIGAVAGVVSERSGVMGVLPGGRGNDFVRMLGMSRKPLEACRTLADGRELAVDIGDVDSRPYVGIASCGFDSEANRIANETKIVTGNLVYAYGLLRAITSWKPVTFTLELDGQPPRAVRGYSVAAANSRYFGGGMMLAPSASLEDGELEVVIIKQVNRLQYLLLSPSVFWGGHARLPYVEILRASRLTISASRPFTMYADGDPIAELPATVSIRRGAVRVLVPAER